MSTLDEPILSEFRVEAPAIGRILERAYDDLVLFEHTARKLLTGAAARLRVRSARKQRMPRSYRYAREVITMESKARFSGRIRKPATRLTATLALLLVLAIAQAATAAAFDKSQFKTGCESGGGSYVESASDNSFSCNLKSGGTIKCSDTKTPSCSYTAKISHRAVLQGLAVGKLKVVDSPAPADSTKTKPDAPK